MRAGRKTKDTPQDARPDVVEPTVVTKKDEYPIKHSTQCTVLSTSSYAGFTLFAFAVLLCAISPWIGPAGSQLAISAVVVGIPSLIGGVITRSFLGDRKHVDCSKGVKLQVAAQKMDLEHAEIEVKAITARRVAIESDIEYQRGSRGSYWD